MSEPTSQDLANAVARQIIADRQNAAYAEAQRLADAAVGPGWQPWMRLALIPSDHRQTANAEPVATVYKVCRGGRKLTESSLFLRRMPDGTIQQAANYESLFGELLEEKHPARTIVVRGQPIPVGRYELCWSALELYHPRSAEALAAAREKREEKAIEREASENPLFGEQIKSGAWRPAKRPKSR